MSGGERSGEEERGVEGREEEWRGGKRIGEEKREVKWRESMKVSKRSTIIGGVKE
jgi:hypothetical protein